MSALQEVLPGTTVELTVSREKNQLTVKLDPVEAAGWFCPDRGFLFEPMMVDCKAQSVGQAFAMGG